MMTVTHGRPSTRRQIFAYTLILAPFAVALGFTSVGGPVYLAAALVLNALFIHGGWKIMRRAEAAAEADGYKAEKAYFRFSLSYLFLSFGALLAEAALKPWGLGGW
jgi:protoheme IX farnesyltransferase